MKFPSSALFSLFFVAMKANAEAKLLASVEVAPGATVEIMNVEDIVVVSSNAIEENGAKALRRALSDAKNEHGDRALIGFYKKLAGSEDVPTDLTKLVDKAAKRSLRSGGASIRDSPRRGRYIHSSTNWCDETAECSFCSADMTGEYVSEVIWDTEISSEIQSHSGTMRHAILVQKSDGTWSEINSRQARARVWSSMSAWTSRERNFRVEVTNADGDEYNLYYEHPTCLSETEFVDGRPFKENPNANAIVAEPYQEECGESGTDVCVWSQNQNTSAQDKVDSKLDTATAWVEQGLHEHASIASFAAFTISLMTNQAPPHLLRDALQAALDELDHTEKSFSMAKLLSPGKTMAPGALPASQLSFDSDLKTLAIGTAREGCIAETLSALDMAIQADELAAALENDPTSDTMTARTLLETRWKIATDEARHSSLAWRTIQWVCQTDEVACTTVKEQVLNAENLSTAVKAERFGDNHAIAVEAWKRIHESLVPATTAQVSPLDCQSMTEPSTSRVSQLVDMIVNGVSCHGNEKASVAL